MAEKTRMIISAVHILDVFFVPFFKTDVLSRNRFIKQQEAGGEGRKGLPIQK